MSRLLGLPERRPAVVVAVMGLVLAATYSAAIVWLPKRDGRLLAGDAVHYYVYLRSMVFDRDLQFLNDYTGLATGIPDEGHDGPEWLEARTATGHIRNVMSVGPAIVWAPLFLLVTAGIAAGRALGAPWPLDGLAWPFQAAASYSGILAATLGAWLTYRLIARHTSRRAAIWATLAMWLGSHAIYYSLIAPQYSHAVSILAGAVFVSAWLDRFGELDVARFAWVGALGGVAALVRWQDVLLLAAPGAELLWYWVAARELRDGGAAAHVRVGRSPSPVTVVLCGAACVASAVVAFAPQLVAWQVLYGRPFLVPQGESFMRWGAPALVDVLFSTWHGLFTWSPIVLVGVLGLAWVATTSRRDAADARRPREAGLRAPGRPVAVAMLVVLALSWYANAAVADWWAGEAYGARRFLGVFPIFAFGLAVLFDRMRRLAPMAAVTLAAVALNFLLLVQYQAFMHGLRDVVPYPKGAYNLFVARFVAPIDLVQYWWSH